MTAAITKASQAAMVTEQVEHVRALIVRAKEAATVQEARELLDKGAALRLLLRRQSAALEVQASAFAITEHAMRRLGELCLELPTEPGRRSDKPRPTGETRLKSEVLAELDVPRATANRWEKRAAIPLREFELRLEQQQTRIVGGKGDAVVSTSAASDHDGDRWGTPPALIAAAREVLGDIELDPASNAQAQKVVGAKRWFGVREDGLRQPWLAATVWLNPPYSKPLCAEFTKKFCAEFDVNFGSGLVLVNNATDTEWAQQLLERFPVCLLSGRVAFLLDGVPVSNNNRGQMVLHGPANQKMRSRFARVFSAFGVVTGRI